jgi:hypothetical protein
VNGHSAENAFFSSARCPVPPPGNTSACAMINSVEAARRPRDHAWRSWHRTSRLRIASLSHPDAGVLAPNTGLAGGLALGICGKPAITMNGIIHTFGMMLSLFIN